MGDAHSTSNSWTLCICVRLQWELCPRLCFVSIWTRLQYIYAPPKYLLFELVAIGGRGAAEYFSMLLLVRTTNKTNKQKQLAPIFQIWDYFWFFFIIFGCGAIACWCVLQKSTKKSIKIFGWGAMACWCVLQKITKKSINKDQYNFLTVIIVISKPKRIYCKKNYSNRFSIRWEIASRTTTPTPPIWP